MSDVEVSRSEFITRQEAAQWLSAVADSLGDGGHVKVGFGSGELKLRVPDKVHCEIEVEVDADEIELEIELKWSTTPERAVAKPSRAPNVRASGRRQS